MEKIARRRSVILLALGLTAIVSSAVAVLVGRQGWDGLLLNAGTEIAGAVLTYGLFEFFIGRAEKLEEEKARREEEKAKLITQMGSNVRDVAVPAADELRRHGWLQDGSLHGAKLIRANLSGADLVRADLSEADLVRADLSEANLSGAVLSEAVLNGANLSGAVLSEAVLNGANLIVANLSEADLYRADLVRADLSTAFLVKADLSEAFLDGADLSGAVLDGAKVTDEQLAKAVSLKGATMPDGTKHE